jgi:hypothetical protein
MNCRRVCPHYGQGMDHCDVGAGYISPYHVEIIVRHCTSRYEDCANYQELSDRRLRESGGESAQALATRDRRACLSSGGLLFPLQFDPEVITILNHEIRTPLTSIRSFTEILLSYPVDDPDAQRRFLQIIQEETVRLARAMDLLFGRAGPEASAPASKRRAVAITAHPIRPLKSKRVHHEVEDLPMALSLKSKGWSVVLAGTGINLALGVLYTWSIFKGAINDSIKQGGSGAFQWDLASINDPYAVCCLVFAFSMILAGKCQDKMGPRFTAMIGGLLVGAGFFLLSMTTQYWMWVLGFGVLVGMDWIGVAIRPPRRPP